MAHVMTLDYNFVVRRACGCETPSPRGNLVILMEQATEPVSPQNADLSRRCPGSAPSVGSPQLVNIAQIGGYLTLSVEWFGSGAD